MEFLLSADLKLNAANYLVANISGKDKPVTHHGFVNEQKVAEYVVKLSKAIEGKVFTANKVDSLDAIKKEVLNSINHESKKSYVGVPEKPKSDVNDEMVKFALDFVNYENNKSKSEKINNFMQQFNSIAAIEEVGDYFSEGLVKLSKIYSIEEILEAVTACIDTLD